MPNKSAKAGDSKTRTLRPGQKQRLPGIESKMTPRPVFEPIAHDPEFAQSGSRGVLAGRAALITGGDSGIGRAVAVLFAREGCDVAISYLSETSDAEETAAHVEAQGRRCLLLKGDIRSDAHCARIVARAAKMFGRLDILVNNAAEQHPQDSIRDITPAQLRRTFETNIFAMFYLSAAALPWLEKSGAGSIINTTSVTAYRGSGGLLDYSATKGAIVTFTRSLSQQLVSKGVRVNAVAPGPIWTPLIPATFDAKKTAQFGSDVPMGRAGEPAEVAGAYLYLAGPDSSYVTGQIIHVNGGEIVNG